MYLYLRIEPMSSKAGLLTSKCKNKPFKLPEFAVITMHLEKFGLRQHDKIYDREKEDIVFSIPGLLFTSGLKLLGSIPNLA